MDFFKKCTIKYSQEIQIYNFKGIVYKVLLHSITKRQSLASFYMSLLTANF